jgi:hypothetical protein
LENIWQYLRGNWLSNRVFDTYDAIIDSWIDVRPKIEEHFKVAAVAGFAPGQMEGDWITNEIGLEVDFRREAAP